MEELEKCAKHLQLLDKTIQESNTRWRSFISSQVNYKSLLKFEGSVLPPPVVTAEKRRAMVMYRKQAYVAEVRLKSATREKDFLRKIQGALDEVRDFHVDSKDSSEIDSGTNIHIEVSESPRPASADGNSSLAGPSAPAVRKPFSGSLVKSKSMTDVSAVGKSDLEAAKVMKPMVKIHRRRRHNSEREREDNSKPPKSDFSPSLARRAQSSSNILAIGSEHHQGELSRARQRYRDERSRGVSPSPCHLTRPASTPPDIPNQPTKHNRTISTHALKLLMKNLDPSHDKPTHQWLASRVSDQEKMDGDISLDDWFQNAPDSVKQKLASLLPKSANADEVKRKSADIHISPVHTCNSSDDTLRSTSPIPDEDITHNAFSFGDCSSAPSSPSHPPLVVIERSPNTSVKDMADSSATINSIDTVIEIDLDSNQHKGKKSPAPFPPSPSVESPAKSGFDEETLKATSAAARKRSLSMQSYTLEEPSEALLNFTHNERENNSLVVSPPSQPATQGTGVDKSKLTNSAQSAKHKTRIPTRQPSHSLLSKCQLDTPSPQLSTSLANSRTSTPRARHRPLRRTDLLGQRSLTPTPPSRVITPTPPSHRPQSEMGTRSSRLKRVAKDSPANQSVRRILPTRPITGSRSSAAVKENMLKLEESPLKDYENREERISRARKQLALLKSKVKAKTANTEKRETETEKKKELSRDHLKVLNSQEVTSRARTARGKGVFVTSQWCCDEQDKENLDSRSSLKFDNPHNDRPIKSVFLTNGSTECSSPSSILSVSSKTNRRVPSADNSQLTNGTHTQELVERMHAVVKGHLCRRLLACTKVKSVVKTIKDCESLLSSIISVSKSSARRDMNFEQRIKLQMNRAKEDLHEIFFYMSASERLSLVKQSEKMLSRQSKRRLGRREADKIERRV